MIAEVSPEGETHTVWRSLDAMDLDLSITWPQGRYVPDPLVEDWTHANYLSYDAVSGAYAISLAGVEGLGSVDRGSGETLWLMTPAAGIDSVATPAGAAGVRPELRFPHSVIQRGSELLVFDQRGSDQDCARALVYDLEGATATVRTEHDGDRCYAMTMLGDALWLDNDNMLVNFSTASVAEEVDPGGRVLARLTGQGDGGFGFMSRVPALYRAP